MNKKSIISIILIVLGIALIVTGFVLFKDDDNNPEPANPNDPNEPVKNNENYNSSIIKAVNKKSEKSNYLISPYSIEIALNMLKESTNNNTQKEIASVVPERTIKYFTGDKVITSNGTFIKNNYKNLVIPKFTNTMKNTYKAELIYDDFTTPDPINNWVNEKTKGMIPKLIDRIDPQFMFGVINALVLDLKYQDKFICANTNKERFTKVDGLHMDVYMMNKTYDYGATYVKGDDYEAISIPYEQDGDNEFELIAINTNDIDKFINNLTDEKIKNIMNNGIKASDNNKIILKLPKFSYEYELQTPKFKEVLMELGIKEVFGTSPDFTNFITKEDQSKYGIIPELGEAIHKTYIDLNEEGTKAAAVTAFLVNDKSSMPTNVTYYKISFDKPFIYLIREKTSNELLFFGVIYEPTKWNGNTCQMTY